MPMPTSIASVGDLNTRGSPATRISPSSGFCTPYRIFISVDLPAPFSPTRAWTVPGRIVSSTSWLAMTPGKRLPMPGQDDLRGVDVVLDESGCGGCHGDLR